MAKDNKELEKSDRIPLPPELLSHTSEDGKKQLFQVAQALSISNSNPLMEKITPEQITKIIDYTHQENEAAQNERKSIRKYYLIIFFAIIFLLVFLMVYFKKDKDILIPILTSIISFGAGFGIGKIKY